MDTAESSSVPKHLLMPLLYLGLFLSSYQILSQNMPDCLIMITEALHKDSAVIDQVTAEQQRVKDVRNYRVFQAMRQMRRDYMVPLDSSCSFVMEKADQTNVSLD